MEKGIEIDIFRPQYADGIVRCFQAVYGEGYPIKAFYDPQALEREFKEGNLYPVVAIKDGRDIIGVMAIYRSSAVNKNLYEAGAGVVLSEYRGYNTSNMLYGYICERLTKITGIEEMFGEAVCNHTKIQRVVLHYGNVETGIEIDLMPAEAYIKEKSSAGRVSVSIHFMCLKDKPQKIYVPNVYEEEFAFLYEDKKRSRVFVVSEEMAPSDSVTQGSFEYYDMAQVGRIMVLSTGEDLESFIDNYENDILSRGALISQVFLRLDNPSVGQAVDILRGRGYFLAGILPRWFDIDGMFMQKVYREPNWDGINLYSSRAERILEMLKKDWGDIHRG